MKKSTANQRKEHNAEKYIQWVTTLSLAIWVYLYLLLPLKSANFHEIFQKFKFIAIQGPPKVIDIGANLKHICNFLLVTVLNFGHLLPFSRY